MGQSQARDEDERDASDVAVDMIKQAAAVSFCLENGQPKEALTHIRAIILTAKDMGESIVAVIGGKL
jgi:hypothetical protein